MTHATPVTVWEQIGLAIGHATDVEGGTGCTVIRGVDGPFRCAAALLGRASGTRELATCAPEHLVDRTDAILLTGGSAYGLDAAAGVMRWLEERQRGFSIGVGVVPIVPAAVLFDLLPFGRFDARPTPAMAYDACETASATSLHEGCIGAGTGALVGKCAGVANAMKGGIGHGEASGGDVRVAALAVVNAFGDVRDAHGRIIAGARDGNGGFVDTEHLLRSHQTPTKFAQQASEEARRNTTLVVLAVSVPLDKLALAQVAQAATAACHRRIAPCGTSFDGDVLFALSPLPAETASSDATNIPLSRIESVTIAALEQAIERGVRSARGRDGIPGLRIDRFTRASALGGRRTPATFHDHTLRPRTMTAHPDISNDRITVRAAVAPLLGEPRISVSLTSQLLAGQVLAVLETRGDWLHVRGADAYEGWTHIGYLAAFAGDEANRRLSLGCVVQEQDGVVRALPHGARLTPDARVLHGEAIDADAARERFTRTATAIAHSASEIYAGASYLWGGVSTWGCDCSGFVQQIFALHGVSLPRDASQQVLLGERVSVDATAAHAPADLLYFSDRDDRRITHVGVALGDGRMVHSALRRGGIAIEQLDAGDEYVARLRAQCVTVQRLVIAA